MTVGGSGFYVLHWKDRRLAYLSIDPLRPTHIELPNGRMRTPGRPRDTTQVGFYEMWNEDQWKWLLGENTEPLVALQRALDAGELRLLRLVSSPATPDKMRQIEADLTGVTLRALNEETFRVAGREVPKYLALDSPYAEIAESSGYRGLPRKGTQVTGLIDATSGLTSIPLGPPLAGTDTLLTRLHALVTKWEDLAKRDPHLKGDRYTGTLDDCAEELREVLK